MDVTSIAATALSASHAQASAALSMAAVKQQNASDQRIVQMLQASTSGLTAPAATRHTLDVLA